MNSIEEHYRAATEKSAQLAKRAERAMPGGDTRTTTYHRPYPLTLKRGEGPFVWDVDGNKYIDLLGNYTSLVHGNAYPPIVEAVSKAVRDGSAWPARSEAQIELATLLCERVESVARVRFCNSGTEAGMLAAHVARRLTGRKLILMARYGYHGSYDDLEVGLAGQDGERTMLADFGEATVFEALLSERGAEIAAVFLEPILGSAGIVEPPAEFLGRVAEAAHSAGAMFVVDEVITLRLAEGGGQQIFDVKPDLTMFGKMIGGGFPVGALGGSEEVMSAFDPRNRGTIFHSGTFNGNPVSCAAGVVSVRELTQARIEKMAKQAERLAAELARAARQVGLPFSVRHYGSLMNVFFLKEPPPATIARDDARAIANFHLAALNQGLFLAPRGMIALSTVITDEVLSEICERATKAMADVAQTGE
ncbi:aspartate aminotransferase family protein [Candidatus Binatus sp.]|jgi:glutamate-1-semialdehyde 2,1-aminomutase|uniref:aspartate aminotransferase family protein n=1 Tax=Candidatus Binatus sp. TaxID=2811406 RepID=UPI003BD097A9